MDKYGKDDRRIHYLILPSHMGECNGHEEELWHSGGDMLLCISPDYFYAGVWKEIEGEGRAVEV